MDLTFQVHMQYCSLQHQTLLPSPVTSTTVCCFCFGSISSVFPELFLPDLQQHIGCLPTWGVHLSVSCLFDFSCCLWHSQGKNTEVVCHSLLQWTTFRTLHHDPSVLGGLHGMAHSFIELNKAEGNGNPLQYSCLENPMDRVAW